VEIDPDAFYMIQGKDLLVIKRIEKILYAEDCIPGDLRRDLANYLNQCMHVEKVE
jgi:hypothetical protein